MNKLVTGLINRSIDSHDMSRYIVCFGCDRTVTCTSLESKLLLIIYEKFVKGTDVHCSVAVLISIHTSKHCDIWVYCSVSRIYCGFEEKYFDLCIRIRPKKTVCIFRKWLPTIEIFVYFIHQYLWRHCSNLKMRLVAAVSFLFNHVIHLVKCA